jgi:protein SCO1/2
MPMQGRFLIAVLAVLLAGPGAAPVFGAPLDEIGGPFTLTDRFGETRSDRDFRGRFMLIFFGYANCQSICPVGLHRMTAALDRLSEQEQSRIQPILITVDRQYDTPEALALAMPKIHPRLLGLTGTAKQLRKAYRAFQIEFKQVLQTAGGKPILAHGSFIYLMRPNGKFATLILPVMDEEKIAAILRRYLSRES